MRTNIEIDNGLMAAAMKATGEKTKKATVVAALREAVRRAQQRDALEALRGVGWEGDLDAMRTDWTPETDRSIRDRR